LKTRKPFSRARKRLREIERIISRRHNGAVPDTDDADVYLEPVVNCFHVIAAAQGRDISVDGIVKLFWFWCERWAPHVSHSQATERARLERARSPKLLADDVVGKAIHLSYEERLQENITAIGSYDADKVMRKKLAADRRRKRDRLRKAEERAAKGATPRANSHSRTKPWEQDGVSRRTWERRRKAAAAQAGADVANSSPHRLSSSGAMDLRHDAVQALASKRGAPKAPPRLHVDAVEIADAPVALDARPAPPPPRPIVVQGVPDGLIVDQDGVEYKAPSPYQRRPPSRDWMSVAMAGLNRGRT
jgi:hypothetical protein